MTNGSEWDMEIWQPEVENVRSQGWKCHTPSCDLFNLGSSYFHVPQTTVCHVLSYDQLQKSWIISKRNAIESETRDCLSSKNAHSPNYCSWLAVCINYSANFYCKIPLINRFKLYLIKILTVTSTKQTKHKQKQRRIYLTFAFSEGHMTASRSPGVTL